MHALRARRLVPLDDEGAAAFGAFAEALRAELAPSGALQAEARACEEEEPGAATVLPPPGCESQRTRDAKEFWTPAAGHGMPRGGA